jgi:hypothetical protein
MDVAADTITETARRTLDRSAARRSLIAWSRTVRVLILIVAGLGLALAAAAWFWAGNVDDQREFEMATGATGGIISAAIVPGIALAYAIGFWRTRLCELAGPRPRHVDLDGREQLQRIVRQFEWWPAGPIVLVVPMAVAAGVGLSLDGETFRPSDRLGCAIGLVAMGTCGALVSIAAFLAVYAVARTTREAIGSDACPRDADEAPTELATDSDVSTGRAIAAGGSSALLGVVCAVGGVASLVELRQHDRYVGATLLLAIFLSILVGASVQWPLRMLWKAQLHRNVRALWGHRRAFWLEEISSHSVTRPGSWRRWYRAAVVTKVLGAAGVVLTVGEVGEASESPYRDDGEQLALVVGSVALLVLAVSFALSVWVIRHATLAQIRRARRAGRWAIA